MLEKQATHIPNAEQKQGKNRTGEQSGTWHVLMYVF